MIASPTCQLDHIWDELQSRKGSHTRDLGLEAGRLMLLICISQHTPLTRMVRPTFIWAVPSAGGLQRRKVEEGGACSCLLALTLLAHPLVEPASSGSHLLQKTS